MPGFVLTRFAHVHHCYVHMALIAIEQCTQLMRFDATAGTARDGTVRNRVGERLDARVRTAHGAILAPREAKFMPVHAQRVISQQPTHQRRTNPQDQLDGLGGLQCPEHPGQNAEDSGLGAIGRHARRGFRKQAPITGAASRHIAHRRPSKRWIAADTRVVPGERRRR